MDTDYRTNAVIISMADEAHRVLENFYNYYRISGYTRSYEVDEALEWLENTIYKFNKLVNPT